MSLKRFSPNALIVEEFDKTLFYGFIIRRNFKPSQKTVTNSSGLLITVPLIGRVVVFITNTSSTDTVYIGDNTVTTANGTPIAPNARISIMAEDNIDIWAVSSGAATDVRILEGS